MPSTVEMMTSVHAHPTRQSTRIPASPIEDGLDAELRRRRDQLAQWGRSDPLVQTTALLVAIASINSRQGIESNIVTDTQDLPTVASLLRVDLHRLMETLASLEQASVIVAHR